MRIINTIRTAFIYKFLNRLKRPSRTIKSISNKTDIKVSQKSASPIQQNPIRQVLQAITRGRILLVAGVVVILLLIILHVHIYNLFATKELFPGEYYPESNYQSNTKDLNLLFVGYSQLPNDEISIGLVSLATIDFQTGKINIYVINTNIKATVTTETGRKTLPLRDFFTQFTLAQGKKLKLIDAVEIMLGLKVDKYVAFNIDKYNEQFRKIGLHFEELQGKYISTDLVKNNSMAEQDAVTSNQEIFIKSIFEQLSVFKFYQIFINSAQIVDTLQTDLDKDSFFSILYNIAMLDKKISTLSTKGKLVTKDDATVVINQSQLYESVRDLNQKLNVITEQAEVEVFNGSGQAGLASRKRRELEQLGINIVRFGNYPELIEGNIIYILGGDLQKYRNTIIEIEKNLDGKVTIDTEGYDENYTGNIILVLGKEISN